MVWFVPSAQPPGTHQFLPTTKTPRSWWVWEPQKCKGEERIREHTRSYFKCPRKAGLARPNHANLILSEGCKGAPCLHQLVTLRSLLSLPWPTGHPRAGRYCFAAKAADKGTFVSVPELGIKKACFSWEAEDMVPVLQPSPQCLFNSFI